MRGAFNELCVNVVHPFGGRVRKIVSQASHQHSPSKLQWLLQSRVKTGESHGTRRGFICDLIRLLKQVLLSIHGLDP